jgi:peptidase inhibitor I78 family protein
VIAIAGAAFTAACSSTPNEPAGPTPVQPGESTPDNRTPSPPPPAPPPTSTTCDASKAQFAIGERASSELLEKARVAAGAEVARFLRPNEPITTEFLSSRLNLNLNAKDVVHSAYCG